MRYAQCYKKPCIHLPGTCTQSDEYKSKTNQLTGMDGDEQLAYALFLLAGRNNWSSAPETMKRYYYGQADKLAKILSHG